MTLRTVTYDDSTHVLVPRSPTGEMIFSGGLTHLNDDDATKTYLSMIAAAPEYQEPVKTMICKRCGVDRFKEHCKQPDFGCPMVATALDSTEYQEPEIKP